VGSRVSGGQELGPLGFLLLGHHLHLEIISRHTFQGLEPLGLREKLIAENPSEANRHLSVQGNTGKAYWGFKEGDPRGGWIWYHPLHFIHLLNGGSTVVRNPRQVPVRAHEVAELPDQEARAYDDEDGTVPELGYESDGPFATGEALEEPEEPGDLPWRAEEQELFRPAWLEEREADEEFDAEEREANEEFDAEEREADEELDAEEREADEELDAEEREADEAEGEASWDELGYADAGHEEAEGFAGDEPLSRHELAAAHDGEHGAIDDEAGDAGFEPPTPYAEAPTERHRDRGPWALESESPFLSEIVPSYETTAAGGAEQDLLLKKIAGGMRDVNALTDDIFFSRHPELPRVRLRAGQTELIAEWRHIRDRLVRPALTKVSPPGGTAADVGAPDVPAGHATPRLPGIDQTVLTRIARYDALIDRVKPAMELTPNLVRGIIAAESGGNPQSGAGKQGYKGLMQAATTDDHLRPEVSIARGAEHFLKMRGYLKAALKKQGIDLEAFPGEVRLRAILATYNAGHRTVAAAVRLASGDLDPAQWLRPEHYGKALVLTGAYAIPAKCLKEVDKVQEKLRARAWNRAQRGKGLTWAQALSAAPPAARCALEHKLSATPGYIHRILRYRDYYDALGGSSPPATTDGGAARGTQAADSRPAGASPSAVVPQVEEFAAQLGTMWSSRRNGSPSTEAIRDWLLRDHRDTLQGARGRYGKKFTTEAISRAWMISREEQMKFQTLSSKSLKPLRGFKPPSAPVERVSTKLIPGSDEEPVAPLVVRFVGELRRLYPGFTLWTYSNHGGGSFNGKGYSIDLDLKHSRDDRGFYRPDDGVKFLRAVGEAARAVNAEWRILYNDFSVADAINRETGIERVGFMGKVRTGNRNLNWHGPAPLILHFHLDLAPR
jgi:hypothetical protein